MKIRLVLLAALVCVGALCAIYFGLIVDAREISLPSLGASDHPLNTSEDPAPIKPVTVNWKGSKDNRWSNPANWEGGRVPGASDVARFAASSTSHVQVDADSSGTVTGLIMEADYHGTLSLERDLTISEELMLAGGALDQGKYRLNVSKYRQTGGTFTGGDANLTIEREATIIGGKLLSSKSMTVGSLTINSPAVMTMTANSKLKTRNHL